MAAQSSKTKIYYVPIDYMIAELRNPRFRQILNLTLKSENPTQGGLWYRFHHGMSFTSYAEKITITVLAFDQAVTQVTVHSECGMPTQIIDWGKNAQNVNAIFRHLEQYALPQQPMYQQPMPQQPVYQQPMPQQPVYQQPMPQQPMYQQPMPQQPVYQQPVYQQPMYQQPMYQQPMQQPIPQQPAPKPEVKKSTVVPQTFTSGNVKPSSAKSEEPKVNHEQELPKE